MKTYEGMFLVDSRKANRDYDEVVATVNGILEKCGASVVRMEKWGERKLAYPINKQSRGVYILIYFEVADENEEAVTDIYRQVEISDTVMRAMVIRIKEVPAEEVAEEPAEAETTEEKPAEGGSEEAAEASEDAEETADDSDDAGDEEEKSEE